MLSDLDDGGSLASDVPSIDKSHSESSDYSSEDVVAPLNSVTPIKPRYLRQRNSGVSGNDAYSSTTATTNEAQATPSIPSLNSTTTAKDGGVASAIPSDFLPQFLHPQNINAPIPKGPVRVRKDSDFDNIAYKNVEVDYGHNTYDSEPVEKGLGRFRTREEIVLHFMIELNMLWRDLGVLCAGVICQFFHSILTNLAYYYHTQLSAAQRIPLKDIAYDVLPVLSGDWWFVSEYLVFTMVAIIMISVGSILVVRWNAPHGRPLYCIPILRRMAINLTCCVMLRCASFLCTTLPGASRQCFYTVPEEMTAEELLQGPAHDSGNPELWEPPTTIHDIIWRMDSVGGCGDLMFSSHTIFTMLFLCTIWRYFNWPVLKWTVVVLQCCIVPFILAARKHYTVDVLTALYVVPLVYQVLRMKLPDLDVHSTNMAQHYGIRFTRSYQHSKKGVPAVVMSMRGGEFFVEPEDLPVDLQRAYYDVSYSKLGGGSDLFYDDYPEMPDEFEPFNM